MAEHAQQGGVRACWRCGSCGHGQDRWAPICPSCNHFDSFSWSSLRAGDVAHLAPPESAIGLLASQPDQGLEQGRDPSGGRGGI